MAPLDAHTAAQAVINVADRSGCGSKSTEQTIRLHMLNSMKGIMQNKLAINETLNDFGRHKQAAVAHDPKMMAPS